MNEAGLYLNIEGFKDFTEALRQLDKVTEDIDSRLDAAAGSLEAFVKKAKANTTFTKFVDGLGALFKELNGFQTNSTQIVQSVNSLTRAFSIMFDVFSKKRSALESMTRQVANFSANRASLTRINQAVAQLGTVGATGEVAKLRQLGDILTGLGKAIDPLNQFRPFFGVKFRILAGQLASAVPDLEKFIKAFGQTAEATEQSRLIFRNMLDLSSAVETLGKLDLEGNRGFLGFFKSESKITSNIRKLGKVLEESALSYAFFANALSNGRLSFNSFEKFVQSLSLLGKVKVGGSGILGIFGGVGPKIQQLSKFLLQSTAGFEAFGAALPEIAKNLGLVIQRFEALADAAKEIKQAFRKSPIETFFGSLKSGTAKIAKFVSTTKTVLTGLPRAFMEKEFNKLAQDAKEGFNIGLLNQGEGFLGSARAAAKVFVEGFKDYLGIASPSRVFIGFGKSIVDGLAQGLRGFAGKALDLGKGFASKFMSGFRTLRTEVQNFSRELAQTAQNSIQRGLQTLTAGGLVGFAQSQAIKFPIQASVDFEDAFAGVIKTVNVEDLGAEAGQRFIEGLSEGIRDLSTGDSPLAGLENAQIELSKIAESAGQLGVARDDILGFTETVGQLQLATDIVGQEGAAQLAQFANIVQTTEFDRIGATITALGNNSATTESQILEFSQRLGAAGRAAGLSIPQIQAIGATMASTGLEAEAGSSAFNQFVVKVSELVAKGGPELDRFVDITGYSTQGFADAWRKNPIAAIDEFTGALGSLDNDQQIQFLNDFSLDGLRVRDTLLRMAGAHGLFVKSLDIAEEAWEANNALQEEAARRFETTRSQINRFRNIVRDVAITIGDTLLPDFNRLLDAVSGMAQRFNDFAKANPGLTSALAKTAIVVGGLVAGAITLTGLFGVIGGGLLSVVASGVGVVTGAFSALTAIFFNPIGVIAGFTAIASTVVALLPLLAAVGAAGFVGFKVLQKAIADVRNNVGGAGDSFNRLKDSVSGLFSAVKDLFGGAFAFANGIITTVIDSVFGVQNAVAALSGEVTKSPLAKFFDFLASRVEAFSAKLQQAANIFKAVNIFAGFTNLGGGTGQTIGGVEISEKTARLEDERTRLTEHRLRLIEQINEIENATKDALDEQNSVTVKQGDTLSGIAAQAGKTVDELLKLNPEIADPNRILTGQQIRLNAVVSPQDTEELERLRTELGLTEGQLNDVKRLFADSLGADRLYNTLSDSEKIVNRFAETDLAQNLFGEITDQDKENLIGALDRIRGALFVIKLHATQIPGAIQQIFSGHIVEGLGTLKSSFSGIGTSIRGMFDAIGDVLGGQSDTPLVALTSSLTDQPTGDPNSLGRRLLANIKAEIEGINLESVRPALTLLFSHLKDVAVLAASFVFGPVVGGVFKLGDLIVDLIKTDVDGTNQKLDESDVQGNFEITLRDHLLPLLGAAATLVLGPAAGAVVGIASLVVKVIEDDFLGLRTLIEQSGIGAAVEDALGVIQGFIDRFTGGGGTVDDTLSTAGVSARPERSGGGNRFISQIVGIVDTISTTVSGIGTTLGPIFDTAVSGIATGIKGFFDAIREVDSDKVGSILDVLGTALNTFLQLVGITGGIALQTIGTVVETALPALGTAASSFVNAVGSLAQGDLEGALTSLGSGLGAILGGAKDLTVGIADNVIGFLERITGAELPSVDEGVGAIVNGLSSLITSIPTVLNNAKTAAELAFDNLKLGFKLKLLELLFSIVTEINRIGAELRTSLSNLIQPLNDLLAGVGGQQIVLDETTFQIDTTDIEMQLKETASQISLNETTTTDLNQTGSDLSQGIIDGFENNFASAEETARRLANEGFKDPIKEELQTNSPSLWGIEQGGFLVAGLTLGLLGGLIPLMVAIDLVGAQFQRLRSIVNTQAMGMASDFEFAAKRIVDAATRVSNAINAAQEAIKNANLNPPPGSGIPGFAAGGVGSGFIEVGEQGRELLFLNKEMAILNNRTSDALLFGYQAGLAAGGGSQTVAATPAPRSGPVSNVSSRSVDNSIYVEVNLGNGPVSGADIARIRQETYQAVRDAKQNDSLQRRASRRGKF